jgi:hypothetical protein
MMSFSLKYETNASSCPRQLPVVPMCLEYPEEEGQEEGHASGPTTSTSTKMASAYVFGANTGGIRLPRRCMPYTR